MGVFRLEFEKNYCCFWNLYRWVFQYPTFHTKITVLTFSTNIALFKCFWTEIWEKNLFYIWNQHSQILLKAKFCLKTKILKLRTKNELWNQMWKNCVIIKTSALEFFQLQTMKSEKRKKEKLKNLELKMLYLSILGWNLKKILPYLKSVFSNLPYCKVYCKNKNS